MECYPILHKNAPSGWYYIPKDISCSLLISRKLQKKRPDALKRPVKLIYK